MKMLVKNGSNEKAVKVLKKEGSLFHVAIGDKEYELDIEKVEEGVYSVIYQGRSINMEMIESDKPGSYKVNTLYQFFNLEVGPASSNLSSRDKKQEAVQVIKAPMPGKIVKVSVNKGDTIESETSLFILSAMKMENEFKSAGAGVVTRLEIKEGDVVKDGQLLVEIKPRD